MAAVWGYAEKLRILCTREFQVSIAESFHAELRSAIERHDWLSAHYQIGRDSIRGANGTEFIFRGLRHNSQAIKSLANIDLTIVEEAETVPEQSWLDLEATVFRRPNSELIAIWNPQIDGSPVDQRFRKNPPKNAAIVEVQHSDNPFFPAALEELRRREQERLDPNTYAHVWEGAYLTNSDSQVFANKFRSQEFTPGEGWHGPYYGLDFGFSQDPTAAVMCWVHDDRLYIEHEAGKVGLELDATAAFLTGRIPGIDKHTVRADSARPESISYLKRHGLPRVTGVAKGKGSVEDGVAHIKQYREVIIHPRCECTLREFRLYSYKVDRLSGDVLPVIVDAHNHYIDACIEQGQLVDTHRGRIPIEDVQVGDMVRTRKGMRRVLVSRMTHEAAPILEMETQSGNRLCATADHLVFAGGKGYVRMDALRYNDDVLVTQEQSSCPSEKPSNMAEAGGTDTRNRKPRQTDGISSALRRAVCRFSCIAKSGWTTTAQYLTGTISTTRTAILATTQLKTLNVCLRQSTASITQHGAAMLNGCESIWRKSGRSQRHGTHPRKAGRSIEKSASSPTRTLRESPSRASSVVANSLQKLWGIGASFALMLASLLGGATQGLTMRSAPASAVGQSSRQASTAKEQIVPDRVLCVRDTGRRSPVYDLMVDDAEEFFASGVLVHNCRYALQPLMKQPTVGIFAKKSHRGRRT